MALERRLTLVKTGMQRLASQPPVKVAFATGDMKRVNQHFGTAESFAIYDLSSGQARLAEVVQFGTPDQGEQIEGQGNSRAEAGNSASGSNTWGHSESKLATKIGALQDCIAIYCQAIGASAISQLHLNGIQAIKVVPGTEIRGLLKTLQEELAAGAVGWLAQALARHEPRSATRFDDMEQEGWIE